MSKPTLPATWDSNATNTVAPTSGHVTDGYANNEVPAAGEFNEWMRRVGLWCSYVDAGIIDGNLEVTGTLTVDGTTHLVGDATVDGNAAVAGLTVNGQLKHGNWLYTGKFIYEAGAGIITVAGTPSFGGGWSGTVATNYIAMGVNGDAFIAIPMNFTSLEKVVSITLNYVTGAGIGNNAVSVYFGLADGTLQLQASTGGEAASGAIDNQTCTLTTPANPFYGLWIRTSATGGGTGPKLTSWRVTCAAS